MALNIVVLLFFVCLNVVRGLNSDEILIVVSYDAFRNEYFDRNVTDFSNQLRRNSTMANYIRNVFPTKTFPNHHSIATGVFPEEHGVMGNALYDFDLGRGLNYSFELFHFKPEIKPIWILNEMAGGHSGCMMWPGSDYEYDGIVPTYSRHYNLSFDYKHRVDEMFSWITSESKPANLVMFYIEEPDLYAHAFGPESQKITDLVEMLNNATKYIYEKIKLHNLEHRANVIHLSDHGMDSLQLKNVIDLKTFLGNEKVSFYGSTPVLQIVPENLSHTEAIFQKLLAFAKSNGHFNVYTDETTPERWHFRNKVRIGPITAVADIGYGFQDMFASAEWYKKAYNITITPETKYGVHGYDNTYETMHPIFFAYGHKIKNHNLVEPFDTVDLFYLFCEILGLEPPEYLKGNRDNILKILTNGEVKRFSRWMVLAISIVLSSALVTTIMLGMRIARRNRTNVPNYLYEEDTTILDDTKLPGYSINSTPVQSALPSTSSFQVA